MSESIVAAIGAQPEVVGFALAGVRVYPAESDEDVRAVWRDLPDAVTVVILTEAAARTLDTGQAAPAGRLTVVMPP